MKDYFAEQSIWDGDAASSSVGRNQLLTIGQGRIDRRWEARIKKLDQADGLEDLMKMKPWTDPMALAPSGIPVSIVYQFDGDQLLPIRF